MGTFLTAHSRMEQLEIPEKWKLIDNQLYKDDDGKIYLCPRNYITDGYTIPSLLSFIGGSKMKYDTRASSQHDFECSYHKVILVNASEQRLRKMGLLTTANGMEICENIPLKYLTIKDTTFSETNERFVRMLQCVNNIPNWRRYLFGKAVFLNVKWLFSKHNYNKTKIYEVDNELFNKNYLSLDCGNKQA